MLRFFAIFSVVLVLGVVMMAGIVGRYGYTLVDPEMRIMVGVCVAVAAYVAWRISGVLKRREVDLKERPAPGGAGQGKLAALFGGGRSREYEARRARLEARKRKLVEEGKLPPEEAPPEPPKPETPAPAPGSSAAMRDRMAARAERVRRAREEGKI